MINNNISIEQKITYIKAAASFDNAQEALDDLQSVLTYNVSDSSMESVVRDLENSTTLIETRTWTPENYSIYKSTRQPNHSRRTNNIATLLSNGWTVKEEIYGDVETAEILSGQHFHNKNTRIATQSNRPQHLFTIHWNVGKRCNYDCAYCPDNLHDYTSKHRSLESFQEIFRKIEPEIPSNLDIKIWFTGGEPTINPNFLPFIKWLKTEYPKRVTNLGLNTNGSRLPKYYKELSEWVEKIQFSSHFGFLKLDEFKDVLSALPLKKFSVNLMAEPEYWDTVQNIVEFCEKASINYHLKRIRTKSTWVSNNRKYDPFYTQEQIEWLEKREHVQSYDEIGKRFYKPDMLAYYNEIDGPTEEWANDMITRQEDYFRGWLCGIGLEGCQIDQYGNIQRGVCQMGGSYAHVEDEKIELPRNFVICTKYRCSCVADNKCTTRYKDIQTKERMQSEVMHHIEKTLAKRLPSGLRQTGKTVSILDKYNY